MNAANTAKGISLFSEMENMIDFLGSPSGEIVAKKSKIDPEASEVETILSGQVLDTHIPGLEEYMSHEIFGPLMRLSPPPCERDYFFNLDDNEGVCELFDVV